MANFLDKGYDINIQAANGETMLMRSVTEGNPETVSYLLSRGIDPELRDNEGRTAFEYIDAISDEDLKQKMKRAFDVVAEPVVEDNEQSSNWWLWLMGAVIVGGGLVLIWVRRSRNR